MAAAKDSDLVVRFMAQYMRLRDLIDDKLEDLPTLTADDDVLRRVCSDLWSTAFLIDYKERQHRRLFANPVDPKFIEAWRDYQERYSGWLSVIELAELIDCEPGSLGPPAPRGHLIATENAAERARESAAAISAVFAFAETQIEATGQWLDEATCEEVERGIQEWENLEVNIGIDLVGILRRRDLTPFVLIPRHVSRHYGESEKLSLLRLLQEAHEAFVFGLPLAAVSLLRSLLELVLTRHYGAMGKDLDERINNVPRLPPGIMRKNLHQLRKLANSIMHSSKQVFEQINALGDIEGEILLHLHTLRLLIEFAPSAHVGRIEHFPTPARR